MADDERVRAYFDARAAPLDRLYDRRPGVRGRLEGWASEPLRWSLALTMAELGELAGKSVLDVGCGTGRYTAGVAERGAHVVGIDISHAMLAIAREHARERGVEHRCEFVEADFDRFEPEVRFDVVLAMSLLEYRSDPSRDLARLRGFSRDKVVLRIPRPNDWRTLGRRVRHRLRAAPPAFVVHQPEAIGAALDDAGFACWRAQDGWFVASV